MSTAFYTALLGIVYLSLTCYVITGRWKYQVSLGDGGEKDLNRRIRAHGNFVETVPFTLILLFFAETYTFNQDILQLSGQFWVHLFGLSLLIGRLLHALGLRQRKSVNRFRQIGMGLTLCVQGGLTLFLLVDLFPQVI